MKMLPSKSFYAIAASALFALPALSHADDAVATQSTTTTTTSAGTVSEYSPDAITVRTTTSTTPTSYTFSKTTTYVDENGNPVSVDVVRSGVPVTVYYTQDGNRAVASKVVVRKTVTAVPAVTPAPAVIEKKTTTTTSTSTPAE